MSITAHVKDYVGENAAALERKISPLKVTSLYLSPSCFICESDVPKEFVAIHRNIVYEDIARQGPVRLIDYISALQENFDYFCDIVEIGDILSKTDKQKAKKCNITLNDMDTIREILVDQHRQIEVVTMIEDGIAEYIQILKLLDKEFGKYLEIKAAFDKTVIEEDFANNTTIVGFDESVEMTDKTFGKIGFAKDAYSEWKIGRELLLYDVLTTTKEALRVDDKKIDVSYAIRKKLFFPYFDYPKDDTVNLEKLDKCIDYATKNQAILAALMKQRYEKIKGFVSKTRKHTDDLAMSVHDVNLSVMNLTEILFSHGKGTDFPILEAERDELARLRNRPPTLIITYKNKLNDIANNKIICRIEELKSGDVRRIPLLESIMAKYDLHVYNEGLGRVDLTEVYNIRWKMMSFYKNRLIKVIEDG